jgi:hypothetical protein
MNSIPIQHKINFCAGKLHLRTILKKSIPVLARRRKQGYGVPIRIWLKELDPFLEDSIASRILRTLCDIDIVKHMYNKFKFNRASREEIHFLWNLMVISNSLKVYGYE